MTNEEREQGLKRHPFGVPRVQGHTQRVVLMTLGLDTDVTWQQERLTDKIGCSRGVVCNTVAALEDRGYVEKPPRNPKVKSAPAVTGSPLAAEWVTELLRGVSLSPDQQNYTHIYLSARRVLRGLGRRYPASFTIPEAAEELGLGTSSSRNFVNGLVEREMLYSCDKKAAIRKYRMTEAGMAWYRNDRLDRGLKL